VGIKNNKSESLLAFASGQIVHCVKYEDIISQVNADVNACEP